MSVLWSMLVRQHSVLWYFYVVSQYFLAHSCSRLVSNIPFASCLLHPHKAYVCKLLSFSGKLSMTANSTRKRISWYTFMQQPDTVSRIPL